MYIKKILPDYVSEAKIVNVTYDRYNAYKTNDLKTHLHWLQVISKKINMETQPVLSETTKRYSKVGSKILGTR